jgi:hypothetical protein
MNQISFFTPIVAYENAPFSQKVLSAVDHYFYLGGRRAHVIEDAMERGKRGVLLEEGRAPSFFITAIKVTSYCTLVLPALALIAKALLRAFHQFYVIDSDATAKTAQNTSVDSEELLGKGVEIPEDVTDILKEFFNSVEIDETGEKPKVRFADSENPLIEKIALNTRDPQMCKFWLTTHVGLIFYAAIGASDRMEAFFDYLKKQYSSSHLDDNSSEFLPIQVEKLEVDGHIVLVTPAEKADDLEREFRLMAAPKKSRRNR